jgi:putative transposase
LLLELAISTYRYRATRQDGKLREQLVELARQRPRFGYRRLHVLLSAGQTVNHKRVWRVYKEAGLAVKRNKRKRLVRIGRPLEPAVERNEEWALDFVSDSIGTGRAIRLLNVADAFTRECLALEVDTSFASRRVTGVLERVIAQRGKPRRIRCDNGPELTSRHFLAWCIERNIELLHIQPGKPMQNGRLESLNGKLRDEFLNVSWFQNLFDARRQAAAWRQDYNEARPHSALGYRTPAAFAADACKVTSPSSMEISDDANRSQGNPAGSLRSALTPVVLIAKTSFEEGEVTP